MYFVHTPIFLMRPPPTLVSCGFYAFYVDPVTRRPVPLPTPHERRRARAELEARRAEAARIAVAADRAAEAAFRGRRREPHAATRPRCQRRRRVLFWWRRDRAWRRKHAPHGARQRARLGLGGRQFSRQYAHVLGRAPELGRRIEVGARVRHRAARRRRLAAHVFERGLRHRLASRHCEGRGWTAAALHSSCRYSTGNCARRATPFAGGRPPGVLSSQRYSRP